MVSRGAVSRVFLCEGARWLIVFLATTIIAAWLLSRRPDVTGAVPSQTPIARSGTMASGMRVVLAQPSSDDKTALGLCIPAGSRTDPPGSEGMAHLAEHLLFSNHRAAAADVRSGIAMLKGWGTKATTDRDRMCFSTSMPSGQLETAVALYARLLAAGLTGVDERDLATARVEIANEKLRILTAESTAFDNAVIRLGFGSHHPYARSLIGDDLAQISLQRVRDWAVPHLVARNAVLAVAANREWSDVATLADGLFSFDRTVPTSPQEETTELASSKSASREDTISSRGTERVALVWTVPGRQGADMVAVDVLRHILEQRLRSSRPQEGVDNAVVSIRPFDLASLLVVALDASSADHQRVVNDVRERIDRLRRDGPDGRETTAAIHNVRRGMHDALNGSTLDRALLFAREPSLSDDSGGLRIDDEVASITATRLWRAAVAWLDPRQAKIVHVRTVRDTQSGAVSLEADRGRETQASIVDGAPHVGTTQLPATTRVERRPSTESSYVGLAWPKDPSQSVRDDLLEGMTTDVLEAVGGGAGKTVGNLGPGKPRYRVLVDDTSGWFSIGFASSADGVHGGLTRLAWTLFPDHWPASTVESVRRRWTTRLHAGVPSSREAFGMRLVQILTFGDLQNAISPDGAITVPRSIDIRNWYLARLRRGVSVAVVGDQGALPDDSTVRRMVPHGRDPGRRDIPEPRRTNTEPPAAIALTDATPSDSVTMVLGAAVTGATESVAAAAKVIDARIRRTNRQGILGAEILVTHSTWHQASLLYATVRVQTERATEVQRLVLTVLEQRWSDDDCELVRRLAPTAGGSWKFHGGGMSMNAPLLPTCESIASWLRDTSRRARFTSVIIGPSAPVVRDLNLRPVQMPWWAGIY